MSSTEGNFNLKLVPRYVSVKNMSLIDLPISQLRSLITLWFVDPTLGRINMGVLKTVKWSLEWAHYSLVLNLYCKIFGNALWVLQGGMVVCNDCLWPEFRQEGDMQWKTILEKVYQLVIPIIVKRKSLTSPTRVKDMLFMKRGRLAALGKAIVDLCWQPTFLLLTNIL